MSLEGRIHNGTVVFSQPVTLAEGTLVRVEPLPSLCEDAGGPSLLDRLHPVVGAAKGLPADASENIDHYLYGSPRR